MNNTRFLLPALAVAFYTAAAQQAPATLFSTALADNPGPPTAAQLASIKFADVNGDGLPDLCFLDSQGIECALFHKDTVTGDLAFAAPTLWLPNAGFVTPITSQEYFETIQYGDINGDGLADLCVRQSGGFFCFPSTGTQFLQTHMKATTFSDANGWGSDPSRWRSIKLVTLTQSGMMDVCGRGQMGIVCHLSMGTIFGAGALWSADYSDAGSWNFGPQYWSTIQYADINGDGLSDVCGRGISGIICALNNGTTGMQAVTGTRFVNAELWTTQFSDTFGWNHEQYYSTIHLGDIDGDRKADVCGRGTAGMYCGVTPMAGTFAGAFAINGPEYCDNNGWARPPEYEKMWLIDMNNDGKADICGRGSFGIVCATSNSTAAGPGFQPAQLWIPSFGDIDNFASSESYWGTVQPIHSTSGPHMVGFCGRGYAGIYCSVKFF